MYATFLIFFLSFGVYIHANREKNCDDLGVTVYEDLGCRAVRKSGESCPVKFECDDFTQKRDFCLFRGNTYRLGEYVSGNLTYPFCDSGCVCENNEGIFKIGCAELDCPEWDDTIEPGCYSKYSVDECCSTGTICPSEGRTLAKCVAEGTTHREGEEFWSQHSCSKCVCDKDWSGSFEGPSCRRVRCQTQAHYAEELQNKCAPCYFRKTNLCCPDTWICPSSEDVVTKVNSDVEPNSDLTCVFGSKTLKLGYGFQRKVKHFTSEEKVQCECIMPPFLTCTKQV